MWRFWPVVTLALLSLLAVLVEEPLGNFVSTTVYEPRLRPAFSYLAPSWPYFTPIPLALALFVLHSRRSWNKRNESELSNRFYRFVSTSDLRPQHLGYVDSATSVPPPRK